MKLHEPFTYFVDRSLGRHEVARRLRDAGLRVEAHDDYFAQDTSDDEWLATVGKRQWVVLTKDKDIRRNALERAAIVRNRVACFMLGRGDLSAASMAQAFLAARGRMDRALRRFDLALAASISLDGHVTILMAGSTVLDRPKRLK